jgi:hypothetical protein
MAKRKIPEVMIDTGEQQFATSDIKSISFKQTHEGYDDNDPLYEGELTITLMDGDEIVVELEWVRAGHRADFKKGKIGPFIEYVVDGSIDGWKVME